MLKCSHYNDFLYGVTWVLPVNLQRFITMISCIMLPVNLQRFITMISCIMLPEFYLKIYKDLLQWFPIWCYMSFTCKLTKTYYNDFLYDVIWVLHVD
jgi:hypothetical protein